MTRLQDNIIVGVLVGALAPLFYDDIIAAMFVITTVFACHILGAFLFRARSE